MASMRKYLKGMNWFLGVMAAGLLLVALLSMASPKASYAAEEGDQPKVEAQDEKITGSAVGFAFLAASICVGLGCIGAAIAVSVVGSAAMGAVAERPELMGRSLIYVGLAEGIAIYGLIVAIMILGKI